MIDPQLEVIESQSEVSMRSLTIKKELTEARDNYRMSGNHLLTIDSTFKYGECVDKVVTQLGGNLQRKNTFDQVAQN